MKEHDKLAEAREGYSASESHEAAALIEALRKLTCNSIHYVGQGVCGSCYANVHDGLAKAIYVIRASARAEGAAEAFERAAKVATPEWLRAAYYYTNPDTAERDHHRAPDISAWRNVAAAISALAKEAAE